MAVQTAVKAPAKDRKTIKEHVTSFTVKQALNFVDIEADSPDKTFEKLLGWAEKFDDGTVTRQLNAFKKTYEDIPTGISLSATSGMMSIRPSAKNSSKTLS